MPALTQKIDLPLLKSRGVSLYLRREDKLHPTISGNKYRKLKFNLEHAGKTGNDTLLTFGGAYSNHIAATATAGRERGFKTVGVVRGEELGNKWQHNPTLSQAVAEGMHLKFISRAQYRSKSETSFLSRLEQEFGRFYLLPEGGTNDLAVKGCMEILGRGDDSYNYICCSVGTGGTLAGLVNASVPQQQIIGFPALKGNHIQKDIRRFALKNNWNLRQAYHFGGYAKLNESLIDSINSFREATGIPLDPVYTGKMMCGILDMVENKEFSPGSRILAIHTGGLQGIAGMNQLLKSRGLPLIES